MQEVWDEVRFSGVCFVYLGGEGNTAVWLGEGVNSNWGGMGWCRVIIYGR